MGWEPLSAHHRPKPPLSLSWNPERPAWRGAHRQVYLHGAHRYRAMRWPRATSHASRGASANLGGTARASRPNCGVRGFVIC